MHSYVCVHVYKRMPMWSIIKCIHQVQLDITLDFTVCILDFYTDTKWILYIEKVASHHVTSHITSNWIVCIYRIQREHIHTRTCQLLALCQTLFLELWQLYATKLMNKSFESSRAAITDAHSCICISYLNIHNGFSLFICWMLSDRFIMIGRNEKASTEA